MKRALHLHALGPSEGRRLIGGAIFAAVMIGLGLLGLASGDFAPTLQPVPKDLPFRQVFAYASASVSLACGVGLLWRRTERIAARVLLIFLAAWFVAFHMLPVFVAPTSQETWSNFGEKAVVIAAAAALYATSEKGLRMATTIFGIALLPFGTGHFVYARETASLVPGWLPWHLFWACFFGVTFVVAGIAVIAGRYARLAASLVTFQMGLFTILVWVPIVASGPNAFQWSEFVISIALTAAGWAVAESYRKAKPAGELR